MKAIYSYGGNHRFKDIIFAIHLEYIGTLLLVE